MDALELTTTAQLLASEFGVTVELAIGSSSGDKAYTRKERNNTHTIVLPMATGKCKGEALAWLRGYLDHEVGHVLFTDFDLMRDCSYLYADRIKRAQPTMEAVLADKKAKTAARVWETCFNLVEDGRIEKLMAERYPGSCRNLRWLSDRLFTEKEFNRLMNTRMKPAWKNSTYHVGKPDKYRDLSTNTSCKLVVLSGYMLHAMRWFIYHGDAPFYGDSHPAVEQSDIAKELKEMRLLAMKAAYTRTQMQASALADQCADLLLDCLDSPDEYGSVPLIKQFLKRDSSECTVKEMPANTLDAQNVAVSKWSLAEAVVQNTFAQGDLADRTFKALAGKVEDGSDVPGSGLVTPADGGHEEADIMRRLLVETVDVAACRNKRNGRDTKTRITDENILRGIDTVCSAAYQVLGSTLQTVTYTPARTGVMGLRPDSRFLTRPSMGDGRIFTRNAERVAIDTNVVLLLDTSGSMANISELSGKYSLLGMAVQVAHGMARALRMLPHVTSKLYAYSTNMMTELEDGMILAPRGGTPTAGAIHAAYTDAIRTSPKSRQVMFVITDGCPDDEDTTRYVIERMLAHGVDMYGLELVSAISDGIVAMMGPDRSAHVSDMRHFAGILNNLMRKALVRTVR